MSEFAVAVTAMVIAGIAVVVSLIALGYASRQTKAAEESATAAIASAESAYVSADAAADTARVALDAEKRARHGWVVERGEPSRYFLRNTGTADAHSVRLLGDFAPIGFDLQQPHEPRDIGAGHSAMFWAIDDIDHRGGDVRITWRNTDEVGETGELFMHVTQLPV